MSTFFWNIRRFNKTLKQSVVKDWLNNKEMRFECILETRMKERKAERILSTVFRDWSSMTNYEHSGGGRIWLLWRDTVRMTPVYKSDQLITCSVALQNEEDFMCSFVYASNQADERKGLWEDLCHHHDSPLFQGKAWIIMGDFNEILDGREHSGVDSLVRWPSGMRDFQKTVLLDRVLMNDVALHRFNNAYSKFDPGGCYDHMRCKIQLLPDSEKIRRPFKYVNAIGKLPNFLPMVKEYWESTEKLFLSTSAMYRFSKKVKNLKPLIQEIGREKLGNLTVRANEAHNILCEKQRNTVANPTTSAIQKKVVAYDKWLHVAELEENFLKQRSKLHWLDVGDQNNKTFHNSIRTRQAQNTMREIRCRDGSTATSHMAIKTEAESFFSEVLNLVPTNFIGVSVEELRDLLDFECTTGDCSLLQAEVTVEEIR